MITGILILLPLLCALILFFLKDERWIRITVLTGSIAEFLISVYGLLLYTTQCHCMLLLYAGSIGKLGVELRFGLDGISLLLVMLTTFLTPLIILSALKHRYPNPAAFFSLIMIMEGAFVGVFAAFDAIFFYIFWEMALIPAYFICALWGGENRIRITLKFFVYTFTGSLFMLIGLIFLYFRTPMHHSFDLRALTGAALLPSERIWVFLAFLAAFAIKIPIFPLHTWQPDTYTASPPAGTMILSGIMLKMGIYGLIRFIVPIFPDILREYGNIVMIVTIIGIIYASVIAVMQKEMRRMIAFSSIAHVGLISAGIFTVTGIGLTGAVIQSLSHGINIVGLFMVIDLIEERTKTTGIANLGGIATAAPALATFFMIFLLGSIALPLTSGFVGEFLLFLGIFGYSPVLAAVAGLSIILGAVYMLWMYQRTLLGPQAELTTGIRDLTRYEILTLAPLALLVIWIGVAPGFFLRIIEPAVLELIANLH